MLPDVSRGKKMPPKKYVHFPLCCKCLARSSERLQVNTFMLSYANPSLTPALCRQQTLNSLLSSEHAMMDVDFVPLRREGVPEGDDETREGDTEWRGQGGRKCVTPQIRIRNFTGGLVSLGAGARLYVCVCVCVCLQTDKSMS